MASPPQIAAVAATALGLLIAGDVVAAALDVWQAQIVLVALFGCVSAAVASMTMWWGVTNREYSFVFRMAAIFTIPVTYTLFFAGLYQLLLQTQPESFVSSDTTWVDPLAGAVDGILGQGLGFILPQSWGARLTVLCAQSGMSFFRMIIVPVALAAAHRDIRATLSFPAPYRVN